MDETLGFVGGGEALLNLKDGRTDVHINWPAVEAMAGQARGAIRSGGYATEQGSWCLALVQTRDIARRTK